MNFLRRIIVVLCIIFVTNSNHCTADNEITRGRIYKPGTEADFQRMIDLHEFVVVDFYADWCHPCRQMDKVITSLAEDDDNNMILFIKVDTEKHHSLAAKYHVYSLPTLVLLVDSKPINTIYGYRDKKTFKQIIHDTFFRQNEPII